MTAHCPRCGASLAAPSPSTAAELRALHAHRTGVYASAYKYGLDVAEGLARPLDAAKYGQGYRDGLALRAYRLPPQGKGAAKRAGVKANVQRTEKRNIALQTIV